MTRPGDIAATVTCVIFGGITGFLLAGTATAVIFALIGGGVGVIAARANVRPAITATVFVGAMAGALVGASIVETLCLPGSCVPLEISAAVIVGIAAFIGVGLVAALVTRSFDEYNEHVDAGREPPEPGCESEPEPED